MLNVKHLGNLSLSFVMTEVYKGLYGISSDIMNDILAFSKYQYNT